MEAHEKTKYHERNLSKNYVMKMFLEKLRERDATLEEREG